MDKVHELQIELLKTVNFKNVSGEKMVADLLAHQELWCAVCVDYRWHIDPNKIPSQYWDPWYIYIFTNPGREDELRSLAETWNPIDICFYCEPTYADHYRWLPMEGSPLFSEDDEVLDNKKLYVRLLWEDVIYPTSGDHPQSPSPSTENKQK